MAGDYLDDVLNQSANWRPQMRPPQSFGEVQVKAYQKRIDGLLGTRDGRPSIQLAWAPSVLKWRPCRFGDAGEYTFPIFTARWDDEGNEVAAPRWVLLERAEPEQYASTWEDGRYSEFKGEVFDWKGPCPSERYTECWRHSYHDGVCCPCRGAECQCTEDCWGNYADPDEQLWTRIRRANKRIQSDPDIQPLMDARFFHAPKAQQETQNKIDKLAERQEEKMDEILKPIRNHFERQPHSSSGLKQTVGGIYVFDS